MGYIDNSYAAGTVAGSNTSQNVGGFVGYQSGGNINNCFATGIASGSSYVGGFIGYNSGGSTSGNYWYNPINTTDTGSGSSSAMKASGYSYFYNRSNSPMMSWTYDSETWSETHDYMSNDLYYPSLSFSPMSFTQIYMESGSNGLQSVYMNPSGYYYLSQDITYTRPSAAIL